MGAYTHTHACIQTLYVCVCVHMSTSNEYFYCSHVAVRFGSLFRGLYAISCPSCVFSLRCSTNEIINLCKGWHALSIRLSSIKI